MKIRKFLPLLMISALASCGAQPAAPQVYDTTVNLPAGGEEASKEESVTKVNEVWNQVKSNYDFTDGVPAISEQVIIDVSVVGTVTTSSQTDFDETTGQFKTVVVTNHIFNGSGEVELDFYHTKDTLPENPEDKLYLSSYVALKVRDLTVNYNQVVNGVSKLAINVNKINLSVEYFYDLKTEDGYLYIDFSDPSVLNNLVPIVSQFVPANYSGFVKGALENLLGQKTSEDDDTHLGGKFLFSQKEMAEYINELLNPEEPEAELPESVTKPLTMVYNILQTGDLINAIPGLLSSGESQPVPQGGMTPAQIEQMVLSAITNNKALKFVTYSEPTAQDPDAKARYGVSISVTADDVMGPEASQRGIDVSIGTAFIVGQTTGSTDVNLEEVAFKVRASVPNFLNVNGSVDVGFNYNDCVTFALPSSLEDFKDAIPFSLMSQLITMIIGFLNQPQQQ